MTLDCEPCQTALCVIARVFPLVNAALLVAVLILVTRLVHRAWQARGDHLSEREQRRAQ